MAITYYMVQIPPVLLFIILTLSCAAITAIGTHYFNKKVPLKVLRAHNEVTGFLFVTITSFYALLLSFVVFVVWGQLNDTHANATNEGSSAMGFYRDIKYYPDSTASRKVMNAYLNYVFYVIDEEFPNMSIMKLSRKTPEALSNLYYEMENMKPSNTFQSQLVVQMFNHLNELDKYRGQRMMSIETEVPAPIWYPLIFGAVMVLLCAMLLDVEYRRIHVAVNSLLGAFIGMTFFIIVFLDHPYTGAMRIKPKAYKEIFEMEEAWIQAHPWAKPIQIIQK